MWAFLGSRLYVFRNSNLNPPDIQKISATVGGNYLDIRDIFDIELTSFQHLHSLGKFSLHGFGGLCHS